MNKKGDKINVLESLKQYLDKIKTGVKNTEYGKLVIIIGKQGIGKSETIKYLCKELSGYKFITMPDENLNPKPIPPDDKKDFEKIRGCVIIEDKEIDWKPGLFVMDDFPSLNPDAEKELYNTLATARHYNMNFIIVAHNYKVINKKIFDFANYILLYKDAHITPQQLAHKVGGLGNGWAIDRALQDLQKYHYYLISCDHKKWHNPPLDSRDTKVLHRAVKGWLKDEELTEINYPKKTSGESNTKKEWKLTKIMEMIEQGKDYDEILAEVDTTREYIWKIKCNMRKRYRIRRGYDRNVPENLYPEYLRDNRHIHAEVSKLPQKKYQNF